MIPLATQLAFPIQRNNRNFQQAAARTGGGVLPPGDTIVQGTICYIAPGRMTGLRAQFQTTGTPRNCRSSGLRALTNVAGPLLAGSSTPSSAGRRPSGSAPPS
jgi:hypothetical protein